METLQKRFLYLIDTKAITPYKLAQQTGVTAATYSRILKTNNIPNTSTISVICNYFNVNDKWLLDGTGPMERIKKSAATENFLENATPSEMAIFNKHSQLMDQKFEKIMLKITALNNNDTMVNDPNIKPRVAKLENTQQTIQQDLLRIFRLIMDLQENLLNLKKPGKNLSNGS